MHFILAAKEWHVNASLLCHIVIDRMVLASPKFVPFLGLSNKDELKCQTRKGLLKIEVKISEAVAFCHVLSILIRA